MSTSKPNIAVCTAKMFEQEQIVFMNMHGCGRRPLQPVRAEHVIEMRVRDENVLQVVPVYFKPREDVIDVATGSITIAVLVCVVADDGAIALQDTDGENSRRSWFAIAEDFDRAVEHAINTASVPARWAQICPPQRAIRAGAENLPPRGTRSTKRHKSPSNYLRRAG